MSKKEKTETNTFGDDFFDDALTSSHHQSLANKTTLMVVPSSRREKFLHHLDLSSPPIAKDSLSIVLHLAE